MSLVKEALHKNMRNLSHAAQALQGAMQYAAHTWEVIAGEADEGAGAPYKRMGANLAITVARIENMLSDAFAQAKQEQQAPHLPAEYQAYGEPFMNAAVKNTAYMLGQLVEIRDMLQNNDVPHMHVVELAYDRASHEALVLATRLRQALAEERLHESALLDDAIAALMPPAKGRGRA